MALTCPSLRRNTWRKKECLRVSLWDIAFLTFSTSSLLAHTPAGTFFDYYVFLFHLKTSSLTDFLRQTNIAVTTYTNGTCFVHYVFLFHLNTSSLTDFLRQTNRAQVLDNDVFAAFEETGDVFDAETAKRCRDYIYSKGNTVGKISLVWKEEHVDLFDNAYFFITSSLSSFGLLSTSAPQELFRQFRGRDPEIKFLLKNRGLV